MEELIFILTDGIAAKVSLNPARALSNIEKSRLSHPALRHDASGNTYFRTSGIGFFLLLEKGNCFLYGVGSGITVGVGVDVAAAQLLQLSQPLSGYRFFPIRHFMSLNKLVNETPAC